MSGFQHEVGDRRHDGPSTATQSCLRVDQHTDVAAVWPKSLWPASGQRQQIPTLDPPNKIWIEGIDLELGLAEVFRRALVEQTLDRTDHFGRTAVERRHVGRPGSRPVRGRQYVLETVTQKLGVCCQRHSPELVECNRCLTAIPVGQRGFQIWICPNQRLPTDVVMADPSAALTTRGRNHDRPGHSEQTDRHPEMGGQPAAISIEGHNSNPRSKRAGSDRWSRHERLSAPVQARLRRPPAGIARLRREPCICRCGR